jgi:hypothetical protein
MPEIQRVVRKKVMKRVFRKTESYYSLSVHRFDAFLVLVNPLLFHLRKGVTL